MSLFKKKDEDRKTIRPRLRPANFGSDPKEKAGTSGKGGGQPAEPTYDVNSDGWAEQLASFKKKGGRNNDGSFGYGYVDENTGIEVPWYIDMINGGGANAAGDTFVSPFEDAPMGGGLFGIGSQAISGGLNAMGVAPYGYNRPRHFMPMEAARVDAEGKPVQTDLVQQRQRSVVAVQVVDRQHHPQHLFLRRQQMFLLDRETPRRCHTVISAHQRQSVSMKYCRTVIADFTRQFRH